MNDTSRRQSSLHHFTVEIEGTIYGGWYRMMPNDCLEVLAIGLMQVRPLDGRIPMELAEQSLAEFIRARKKLGEPVPAIPVDSTK
jgi:hypothetical protein